MKKFSLEDMKALAAERGGLCLSNSYSGSKMKMHWRCMVGHEWEAAANSVTGGSWCKKCAVLAVASKRRIPLEEIQALALSKSGECLSEKYEGNKNDKLRWRCAKGHEWNASLGKVKNGNSWCPICANLNRRLTLQDMQDLAHSMGGVCISNAYQGQAIKLRWRCAEGDEWDATPGQVRNQGSWCPKCLERSQLSIEELRSIAISRGGECISEMMPNANTKLLWRCSEGHSWSAKPHDIKHGHWCRRCARIAVSEKQRTSFDELQLIAASKGGRCIPESYFGNEDLLQWVCALGHEWKASIRNIKHNNSWCPICSSGVSERICRAIFEELFNVNFNKHRPDWLLNDRGNWMELDGYSPILNLAFEYQGIQHYKQIAFFHGQPESLEFRKRDDLRKKTLCHEHGICLIEIPYTIPHLGLEEYIRKLCKINGFIVNRSEPISIQTLSIYNNDPINALMDIARTRGGNLISNVYIDRDTKLLWRCKEGHEWKAKPDSIKNAGSWCPICGVSRRAAAQRLTLSDMQVLAKSRGGAFLSKDFLGVNLKYRWQCANHHEWEAKANNVKRGSWCPICLKTNKNIK